MTLLLVVDDEALILHMVNDALEEGGYSTVQALSGEEQSKPCAIPIRISQA